MKATQSAEFKFAELHAERAEMLELIAQARELIGHIGWTSAEGTDVIRRRYTTGWGTKTALGLYRTIERIVLDGDL